MADQFTAVDLSQLPFPDAVEVIDFETILAEMLLDFQARMEVFEPGFTALIESDPAYKILEVAAYREVLLRQRVNEAIKAVCLAYAIDNDQDNIAARYNVERLLLDPGDPDAVPPVEPTYESNEDFRRRIQLSFEGFSVAGPEAAYKFHGISADADVLDISVQRPDPGDILITVLSRVDDGVASSELLDAVEAKLSDETIRPLNDTVIVQGADIETYTVVAELELLSGPDPDVVLAAAQAKLDEYTANAFRLGVDIVRSSIFAALHQPGVYRVNLTTPAADIPITPSQAPRCTGTTLTTVAASE